MHLMPQTSIWTPSRTLIAPAPNYEIKALETIQTSFLWNNSSPKIKHKNVCKRYENGGLKNVDIRNKVNSLQSSWVKILYYDCFHEWEIIPLYQLKKTFGSSFKLLVISFKSFIQEIFLKEITSFLQKYVN